jgi:hypothetical protein
VGGGVAGSPFRRVGGLALECSGPDPGAVGDCSQPGAESGTAPRTSMASLGAFPRSLVQAGSRVGLLPEQVWHHSERSLGAWCSPGAGAGVGYDSPPRISSLTLGSPAGAGVAQPPCISRGGHSPPCIYPVWRLVWHHSERSLGAWCNPGAGAGVGYGSPPRISSLTLGSQQGQGWHSPLVYPGVGTAPLVYILSGD